MRTLLIRLLMKYFTGRIAPEEGQHLPAINNSRPIPAVYMVWHVEV